MVDFATHTGAGIAAFDATAALLACEAHLDAVPHGPELDSIEGMGAKKSTHTVYNFEVEGPHTYIADGIRVHNTSALSFLANNEIPTEIITADDGSGRIVGYVAALENGKGKVTVRTLEADVATGTVKVEKVFEIDRDGSGVTELKVENTYGLDANGKADPDKLITSNIVSANLKGSQIGEATLQSLTPFLSRAILGDDATILENVAANTVLDALLGNIGELTGGVIDVATSSFLQEITGENAEGQSVIEQLAEKTFEDFGGDLVQAGVDNALTAVNQLIMAEIFESSSIDGVPGAILETVTSSSINAIISNGLTSQFVQDLLPDGSALENAVSNAAKGGLPSEVGGWTSLIFTSVINEVLPDIETQEGVIASAITSSLVGTLSALGNWAGPFGAVAGFIIGKIFDSLFGGDDPEPQAWTNVGFDEETGRFKILGTWEDDGGNSQLSRDLAQAYIDGINGFIDIVKSQSHNFDELGQWSFGHFEDSLKNLGESGNTFADFQSTYLSAYLTDIGNVELNDGQMAAVRAVQSLNVQKTHDVGVRYKELVRLYENRSNPDQRMDDFIAELMSVGSFGYYYLGYDNDYTRFFKYDEHLLWGNEFSTAFTWPIKFYDLFDAEIGYLADGVAKIALIPFEPADSNSAEGARLANYLHDLADADDLLELLGVEGFYSREEMHELIFARLQIAHDYHTYLENTEEINELILAMEGSNFAAGWIQTLALVEELGLNDPYDLTGDEIDNVFYTADGDDIVRGATGDDLIKTYGGNDELRGNEGNDTLIAGTGDDLLVGGTGNDSLVGDAGVDTLYGGEGDDDLSAGAASNDASNWQYLDGGAGSDTYNYAVGDGFVRIGADAEAEAAGDIDRVVFEDLNLSEMSFSLTDMAGTSDSAMGVALNIDWEKDGQSGRLQIAHAAQFIEEFLFADGERITGVTSESGILQLQGALSQILIAEDAGNYTLEGAAGHDTLLGDAGNDTLLGDDGDDLLLGGAGADELKGGSGSDTVSYAGSYAAVNVNLSNQTASGGHADGDTIREFENAIGSDHDDYLAGDTLANVLIGGVGNDTIRSADGDDTIIYVAGDDYVHAGRDADTFDLSKYSSDQVSFRVQNEDVYIQTPDGDIRLYQQVRYEIGNVYSNIEALVLSDVTLDEAAIRARAIADQSTDGDDSVLGTKFDDVIVDGPGNDTIKAGYGDDTITYQAGDDYIDAGRGADTLDLSQYSSAQVSLRVSGDDVYVQTPDGEIRLYQQVRYEVGHTYSKIHTLVLSDATLDEAGIRARAIADQSADGNDSVAGSKFDDVIIDGLGNDTIKASYGDDTITYDSGDDLIDAGRGTDTLDLSQYSSAQVSLRVSGDDVYVQTPDGEIRLQKQVRYEVGHTYSNVETLVLSDATLDEAGIRARAIADQSTEGNDSIVGSKFDDVISGGTGNDTLDGNAGSDEFVFAAGDGQDTIVDYNAAEDSIRFNGLQFDDLTILQTGSHVEITYGTDALKILNNDALDFNETEFVFV